MKLSAGRVLARLLVAPLLLAGLAGCQMLWASSKSPSDSISASVESIGGSIKAISTSSGSGGGDSARNEEYRRDLRAYAAAFVETDGDQNDFLRGVARIAEGHGITHWEAEPTTLVAIGEGLRAARVPEPTLRLELAGVDARTLDLVLTGYHEPTP